MTYGKNLKFGVGINDANYTVMVWETVGRVNGKQKQKLVKACPFFMKWNSMLTRCYSEVFKKRKPTYIDCSVCEEWLTFSNFKAWMEQQDWEGKALDKDLLVKDNKVYSPNTCIFVDIRVNNFILDGGASARGYPTGVYVNRSKFEAKCRNIFTKKTEHLGSFDTPEEAHAAWLKRKQEHALQLASEQTDERVAKAIIDRYFNYSAA